jgi:hypothetical protein
VSASAADDLVITLSANSEPFRLAMERAVRSVCDFADALNRIPGGWEALRKSERRYQVHQRRIGIELRRRDRRAARRASRSATSRSGQLVRATRRTASAPT